MVVTLGPNVSCSVSLNSQFQYLILKVILFIVNPLAARVGHLNHAVIFQAKVVSDQQMACPRGPRLKGHDSLNKRNFSKLKKVRTQIAS